MDCFGGGCEMRVSSGFYQPPGFINPYPIVHLPQLQLGKFTGDIERFPIFVQEFKAFVESQCFDDYRRLQMHLVGEPANLILSSAYPNKSEPKRKFFSVFLRPCMIFSRLSPIMSVPAIHKKTMHNHIWPCLYCRSYLVDFFHFNYLEVGAQSH